jgi:hypothetical protein
VLRASPRLGEVRVGTFDARVLVAVAELLGETEIAVVTMLFVVSGALGAVGVIIGNLRHGKTPQQEILTAQAGLLL